MKLQAREIQMTCSLELTQREVEMLNYLSGFKGSEIGRAICGELTREYKPEDWDLLFSNLRGQTETSVTLMKETKLVFSGMRKATRIEEKSA